MAKAGPKKVQRYTPEFKLTAVKLCDAEGVLVQDVAEALDIHPWMLSRWRTEAKQGLIQGKAAQLEAAKPKPGELRQLRQVKGQLARTKLELEILKKAIRFCSDRVRKSSFS